MNKRTMYEQLVIQTQMNYSQYYGVYASGGTPVKLTEKPQPSYDEQIEIFADKIKKADHIVIGGASGLSAAGGGDFYYTDSPSYKKHFAKFRTIPLRVDTLNNKSVNPRGCFAL
ncbi:hypothetical protein [Limosilactobacillus portuensis]|uniref:hypothetical protein n=1 Tax=Limosilactobacillus portuensis TaxID=2742601 RepID=UPI003D733F2E